MHVVRSTAHLHLRLRLNYRNLLQTQAVACIDCECCLWHTSQAAPYSPMHTASLPYSWDRTCILVPFVTIKHHADMDNCI